MSFRKNTLSKQRSKVRRSGEASGHAAAAVKNCSTASPVRHARGGKFPTSSFLETVKYLGENATQDIGGALAHVESPIVRTAIVATEAYAASQACGFQEPTEFILVAVAPRMSLIACKFASSNFCVAAIVFGNLLLSLFRQPRAGAARSLSATACSR